MGLISLVLPSIGEKVTSSDPRIVTAFSTIQTAINGNLNSENIAAKGVAESNLATAVAEKLVPGKLSWGYIKSDGTITRSSGDFSCAKGVTGVYQITWTVARGVEKYGVGVTAGANIPGENFTANVPGSVMSTASFEVYIVNLSGAKSNAPFAFVAASS